MSQYYRKSDIDNLVTDMERILSRAQRTFHEQYGSPLEKAEANILWSYGQAINHIKTLLKKIDEQRGISIVDK